MTGYMHAKLAMYIQEMVDAINQAIKDANRNKTRYVAIQGQLHTNKTGNSYYTFTLEGDWEPPANTSVQIEIDQDDPERTIAGTILSTLNAQITLVTEVPLPQSILTKVTLFEATVWLLEKLLKALEFLQEQGETLAQMAAKTYGLLPCYEGQGKRKAHIATFTADADQNRAITIGMESERIFLIGPPGSGKTSVESALAIEYLLANETVLLAAYTNVALDNAMKRLKQYCEESGNEHLIKEHRIVRIGRTQDLAGKAYQDISLQGIVDQHLGQFAQERDKLRQEQSDLESSIAHLSRDLSARQEQWMERRQELLARLTPACQERALREAREGQRLENIATRLATIATERQAEQEKKLAAEQAAKAWAAALPAHIEHRRVCHQALERKIEELLSLRTSSPPGRIVSRLLGVTKQSLTAEVEQCQANLDRAKQAVTAHEQNRDAAYLAAYQSETQILTLDNEERQLRREQRSVTVDGQRLQVLAAQIAQDEQALKEGDGDIAVAEEELARERTNYHQVMARLKEIEDEQRTVTSRVIDNAKFIGTTLTGITTSPHLRDRVFDAVMIDEASMASLIIALVAVARATRHVGIFGDPLQLPPIVKLKDKKETQLAEYWLGTELFSHLKLTLNDADAGTNQVVLLSQQSRMLPEIAAPVSQYIYGGRLKNRVDPNRIPIRLAPHPEWPLMLVDTSDVDRDKPKGEQKVCHAKRPAHSTSKYNLYHVDCVVQLVLELLPQLANLPVGEPRIGIVTPYAAQKTKLQKALREHGLLHLIHVGTVHSFQSIEYPCIIFDTVEGYGIPIKQFTSNAWGRQGIAHSATRLINVAHSRARDKLIYVANVDYIRQEPYRKEHVLTKFVNYAYEQGHIGSCELLKRTKL